jgi:hypothetical protein
MEMPDFAPPEWQRPDLRRRNGKEWENQESKIKSTTIVKTIAICY